MCAGGMARRADSPSIAAEGPDIMADPGAGSPHLPYLFLQTDLRHQAVAHYYRHRACRNDRVGDECIVLPRKGAPIASAHEDMHRA
jgi:hypothetical protein